MERTVSLAVPTKSLCLFSIPFTNSKIFKIEILLVNFHLHWCQLAALSNSSKGVTLFIFNKSGKTPLKLFKRFPTPQVFQALTYDSFCVQGHTLPWFWQQNHITMETFPNINFQNALSSLWHLLSYSPKSFLPNYTLTSRVYKC